MAASAVRLVWEKSQAKNGALLVLLAIADEAGKEGIAEMNVTEIAAKARLSVRAARLAIRDLEALGELSTAARAGGPGRSSYRVCMANPAKSAGSLESDPEESAGSATTRQNLPGAESAGFKPGNPRSDRNPAKSAGSEKFQHAFSTTGSSLVEVKDESETGPDAADRLDVERLCRLLADRIEANGSRRPKITKKWRDAARRLMDIDGRTEEQVTAAIEWCQKDEFWKANILSMPKLREKYDQLRLHATRERNAAQPKATTSDRARQAVEAGQRLAAMMNGRTG